MISNKQILISLFLTFCYVTVIQALLIDGRTEPMTSQEVDEFRAKVFKDCNVDGLVKEGANIDPSDTTSEAYQQLLRKSKCSLACFYKMSGITTNDNQLNKKGVYYAVPMMLGRNHEMKSPQNQYDQCSHITESDRCEYAWKLHECFLSAWLSSVDKLFS